MAFNTLVIRGFNPGGDPSLGNLLITQGFTLTSEIVIESFPTFIRRGGLQSSDKKVVHCKISVMLIEVNRFESRTNISGQKTFEMKKNRKENVAAKFFDKKTISRKVVIKIKRLKK